MRLLTFRKLNYIGFHFILIRFFSGKKSGEQPMQVSRVLAIDFLLVIRISPAAPSAIFIAGRF